VLFTRVDGPCAQDRSKDGDDKAEGEPEEDHGAAFEFHYKPADIKAHLDRYRDPPG
jgi:hypothetical protein